MDFALSEDQALFRDSIARVVMDLFPFDQRQKAVASNQGFRDEDWQQLAELGCMAAPFPETFGGFDGGADGGDATLDVCQYAPAAFPGLADIHIGVFGQELINSFGICAHADS